MKFVKTYITKKQLCYLLGFALFFLIWWLISYFSDDHQMIFPGPVETLQETFRLLGKTYVYGYIASTLTRLFIGFGLSFALGLIVGLIAGQSVYLKDLISPTIISIKSIPTASLVFLFLIVFGFENTPIAMVIIISFPIIYESVVGGIENLDQGVLNAMKIDSGHPLVNTFKIKLPLLFPYLMVGISSSLALSLKIEIMSEILSGYTMSGIGSAILTSQSVDPSNMLPIFAYSLIAIILALLFDLLTRIIKKLLKIKTR